MDWIYIVLFQSDDPSKRIFNTSLHSLIHTHIHTMAARPPAHYEH